MLDNERESVFHLNLPMLYDSRRTFVSPIGFNDRRRKDGEILDPVRFPPDVVDSLRKKAGLTTRFTQYQQQPLTEGGNLIKTEWFQYYTELPHIDMYYTCWDFALKSGENNDYSVGLLMGRSGSSFYVLDIKREKADTPRQLNMIREYQNAYPHITKNLVEGGNGDPIVSMLQREIGNFEVLLPRTYGGSKENRVRATIPLFLESKVFFPASATWLVDLVKELASFPGKHDDQVDALVYALLWGVQYDSTGSTYLELHRATDIPRTVEEKSRQGYNWQKESVDVLGSTSTRNIRSIFY
jgi:predicted phage terminase large subunit-like protein